MMMILNFIWPVPICRIIAVAAVLLAVAATSFSQVGFCEDSGAGPSKVVRSVRVVARWAPELTLPLKPGDQFSPQKIRETRLAFLAALRSEKEKYNSASIGFGKLPIVDVNFVRVCGKKVPENECRSDGLTKDCVDVELKPFALSTDPGFLGSVLLPISRSNKFTFLSNVPKPIRLLNPKFSLDNDERTGTTPGVEISTDLLSLGEVVSGQPTKAKKTSLLLNARAGRSIGEPFYNTQIQMSFVRKVPNEQIESVGLETGFDSINEPKAKTSRRFNIFRVGGHLAFSPKLGLLNQVYFGAGFRWSRNHLEGAGGSPGIVTSERSFDGRAILGGRLAGGFTRAGIWLDGGKPGNTSAVYTRIAGMIGYEKEVPLSGHTIGVEALAGAGQASRSTPVYELFLGGNTLNNFLYLAADDLGLKDVPSGPIMRGFGKNQAGLLASPNVQTGGNRYRHFNLTISIPIPGLSKPLIPDEIINQNPSVTLRDVVDLAVNSGEEALSLHLQDEGLPEDQADRDAEKIFGEIKPGMEYLTRYAKIYAIKPMIMFDASSMAQYGGPFRGRYSLGGGLQLTIAVAKLEVGYLHNTKRVAGDRSGNFVVRIVFQNLF